jgi:predicted transcriptional regulator
MSRVVTSVVADEDMDVAARLMASQRIRHLPVLDGNRVVGVISIRDVVRFCVGDTTRYDEGQHLHELVDLV